MESKENIINVAIIIGIIILIPRINDSNLEEMLGLYSLAY
jgi:hypothetical protein